MLYKYIQLSITDRVAILKLNRPDKLNALNFAMVEEISHAISLLDTTKLNALIITGNEKAFCAGGDLNEMKKLSQTEAERRSHFLHQTFTSIHNMNIPVVAFIQGYCFGGGLEIALHCDYRICSKDAQFAFPEVKYNIIPGAGGTVMFPIQTNNSIASFYLFTGKTFNAEKSLTINLVQDIFEDAKKEMSELISFYNKTDSETLKAIKEMLIMGRNNGNKNDRYKNEAIIFSKLLSNKGSDGIEKNFNKNSK